MNGSDGRFRGRYDRADKKEAATSLPRWFTPAGVRGGSVNPGERATRVSNPGQAWGIQDQSKRGPRLGVAASMNDPRTSPEHP